jgi:hypothetical protein
MLQQAIVRRVARDDGLPPKDPEDSSAMVEETSGGRLARLDTHPDTIAFQQSRALSLSSTSQSTVI